MSRESIKGFALGLFVSTAFLGGYYFLEEKDKKEITIEQLEEASEELGYTLVKTGDDSAEEKESMKEVEEPFSQESDSLPKIQTSGNSTKASSEVISYTLTISTGMGSDKIALILFENNIIENADNFEQYLKENNIARKIRVGEFQLTNEMSFERIASIVTKQVE